MSRRLRLDAEMVRRGLVAQSGRGGARDRRATVLVNGAVADKPARLVDPGDAVVLQGPPARFVSRGGEKLDAALDAFGIDVAGRRVLDAGASTVGSPTACCSAAQPTWWRSTSATASCIRRSATISG